MDHMQVSNLRRVRSFLIILRFSQMEHIMTRMDDLRINTAVGAEIRAARARCGWSRKELSARSEVPAATLRRYEDGSRAIPVGTLVRLTTALEIDISDINRVIQRACVDVPENEATIVERDTSRDELQPDAVERLRAHQRRFTDHVKRNQHRPNKGA